jgi:mRNA-degrading endonuclease YafQ of YafQ-DinJ toxin-antitoxin module
VFFAQFREIFIKQSLFFEKITQSLDRRIKDRLEMMLNLLMEVVYDEKYNDSCVSGERHWNGERSASVGQD